MSIPGNLVRVMFETEPDGPAAGRPEFLWAKPLRGADNGYFEIQHTPFYVDGVSYLDVVEAIPDTGAEDGSTFHYQSTVRTSGRSTFRLFAPKNSVSFEGRWSALQQLGCVYDCVDAGDRLLCSVDVPEGVDIVTVYRILHLGSQHGVWSFEEANCRHTVTAPS